MLNLKGAFVVISESTVAAHILADTAYKLYLDRVGVVGFSKANIYTFGTGTLCALPCTAACMEEIALGYEGIHATLVKAICACIALGKPIPNHSDNGGGLGIKAAHTKPIVPSGGDGALAEKNEKLVIQRVPKLI